MNSIEVVVPCTRPAFLPNVIKSFEANGAPELMTVVSNLDIELQDVSRSFPVRQLKYESDSISTGPCTVGLKRNIGAWWAQHDYLVLFDDDQLATSEMIANFRRLFTTKDYVYGHHRFFDYTKLSIDELLNVNPLDGVSREYGTNTLHGWQSGYGGLAGYKTDFYIAMGGTDLWWSNKGSHEDQDLARRICQLTKSEGIYIHEPPVAIHPLWKPEHRLPSELEPSNVCDNHDVLEKSLGPISYEACSQCPWHIAPRMDMTNAYPLMPFNPRKMTITEKWL